ncbi:cytochrome P450 [Fennellomyces sp. T-0311]|nr:cytochrome P450 [Fennellomyces sp. T-0311]
MLSQQPDFNGQKTMLEEVVVEKGHIFDLYPKFHCETNWIERYWGAAKLIARRECDYSLPALRKNLNGFLDSISPVYDDPDNEATLMKISFYDSKQYAPYNGYLIPEGTIILGNIYSLCRNGEYYDDPDEFKPDRYLNDTRPLSAVIKGTAKSREQHLFGWGRRICAGAHLADAILFNVWVRILHTAVIEPPLDKNGNHIYPDLDSFYDAGTIVGPGEPHLRFTRRTDGVQKLLFSSD